MENNDGLIFDSEKDADERDNFIKIPITFEFIIGNIQLRILYYIGEKKNGYSLIPEWSGINYKNVLSYSICN